MSMVPAHHSRHGGQANPRSFEIFVPMQTVEGIEQLVFIMHIEPRSVIPDVERILDRIPPKFDLRFRHF